jgi:hypothetical protein
MNSALFKTLLEQTSRRSFRSAGCAPSTPTSTPLCAGVSFVASRRVRAAAALRAAPCWPRRTPTFVPSCAQVPTVGVASAGACPDAVRARARPLRPLAAVCRRVVALRRARFVAAALHAASCSGRATHSRLRPPVLRRRPSGPRRCAFMCAFQWRHHRTRAIASCACVVARRARGGTRGGTRGMRLGTFACRSNAPGLASTRPCLVLFMLH